MENRHVKRTQRLAVLLSSELAALSAPKRRTISAFHIIHTRANPGPAETVSCSHHHTGESARAATDSSPRLPPLPGPSFAGDRGDYHRLSHPLLDQDACMH